MPGYGKSMKPDEIKDMVAYIRGLAKLTDPTGLVEMTILFFATCSGRT
jgi:hypothetical protein